MGARFRSWWQKIKNHWVAIGVVAIVLVLVIVLIIIGYCFDWTGFNGYNQVTITRTLSGTNAGTVIRTEEYQSGKGLWDWLQLLGILAIPVVVGFGAAFFTARQNHDREIALDNQREAMLQTYLDKMSELLLHENLRKSKSGDDVVNVARARTLTVLPKLDPTRKRSIILFLAQSSLIDRNECVLDLDLVDLRGVDLSQTMHLDGTCLEGADLTRANLSGADLTNVDYRGVNLHHANLTGTNLWGAILEDVVLTGADLTGADLKRANLKGVIGITVEELEKQTKSLKGATMPDGSIHP